MSESNPLPAEVDALLDYALREDLGAGASTGGAPGDHSSLSCIPADAVGEAHCLVKDSGVLAGVELAGSIAAKVDPRLQLEVHLRDGARVAPGDVPFIMRGPSVSILVSERLVLNFMQRMSGIATLTRQFVDAVSHTRARILDTRKTGPGLRYFEKWAVRIGGGFNHRMGLYDMIMLKDNHVDFSGGIALAIDRVEAYQRERSLQLPVEIETRNLDEVRQVLERGGVTRIMLDNFDLGALQEAVDLIAGRFETEASGGVNLATVGPIAGTGVDFISVGALTHSVHSLDISLKARQKR